MKVLVTSAQDVVRSFGGVKWKTFVPAETGCDSAAAVSVVVLRWWPSNMIEVATGAVNTMCSLHDWP